MSKKKQWKAFVRALEDDEIMILHDCIGDEVRVRNEKLRNMVIRELNRLKKIDDSRGSPLLKQARRDER